MHRDGAFVGLTMETAVTILLAINGYGGEPAQIAAFETREECIRAIEFRIANLSDHPTRNKTSVSYECITLPRGARLLSEGR